MRIIGIHHLTLAVRDAARAEATFAALFGAGASPERDVGTFGVRTRDLVLGESTLQLAAPLSNDSTLMRFLERKGEGFYNLALEVDDLDAAVAELTESGVPVSEPVESTPGVRSAFVSMSATHGLSIQLVQVTDAAAAEAAPEEPPSPPARALDLTPDEWTDEADWSDTD